MLPLFSCRFSSLLFCYRPRMFSCSFINIAPARAIGGFITPNGDFPIVCGKIMLKVEFMILLAIPRWNRSVSSFWVALLRFLRVL